jgi:hypothetical protein
MRHFAFTEQVFDRLLIVGNWFLSALSDATEREERIQSEARKACTIMLPKDVIHAFSSGGAMS